MRTLRLTLAVLGLTLLGLAATAEAVEKVQYFCTPLTPGTNTVMTTIKVGQEVDLGLFVRDLRPAGTWIDFRGASRPLVRGVFAAYCDLAIDAAHVTAGDVVHSPNYPNGLNVGSSKSPTDNVGGFSSSFSGMGTTPREVFRVRLKAVKAGTVKFTPTFDVPQPQCDTLVYGNIAAEPPEESHVDLTTELRINGATLTIVP